MIHRLAQHKLVGGRSRFLVLLAALLLAGTPLLEASHNHDAGAAYADCLLCKQTSDLPVVSAPGALPVVVATTRVDAAVAAMVPARPFYSYAPRGPPPLS